MKRLASVILTLSLLAAASAASPPTVMNHQGRIAVDNINVDATAYFKFALVDGVTGDTLWANDGTPSGEPAAAVTVTVSAGHYAVPLGDSTVPNMTPIDPATFAANSDVRLRLWFATTPAGPFQLLSPDRRLTTSGYAFSATTAQSVAPASITAASLQPSFQSGDLAAATGHSLDASGTLSVDLGFSQPFAGEPSIDLSPGWTTTTSTTGGFSASTTLVPRTVDADGITGTYTSVAIIAGHPAIAYYEISGGNLRFVRANDPAGSTWGSPITVDGALADAGQFASLAEVDGHPAIAYYDATAGDLKFARAADPTGSSWPQTAIVTIDGAAENAGQFASLAVVAGLPVIAYHDASAGTLKLATAADTAGTVWPANDIVTLIPGGHHASLIGLAGSPAIAHVDPANASLYFTTATGPGSFTTVLVDDSTDAGQFNSLAVVAGHPAVSYLDATNGRLRFARASTSDGFSWPTPTTVAAPAATFVGQHSALTHLGPNPAIAYYDATHNHLKLVAATTADGSAWGTPATVDSAAGPHISVATASGLPVIAYHDPTDFDLKVATAPPTLWAARDGDPLPVLASGVKDGAVTGRQLAPTIGVWHRVGTDIHYDTGRVGIGRSPTANALEVAGDASKSTAGAWLANSDRRIKTGITTLDDALATIGRIRPVRFHYTPDYLASHPEIPDTTYYNVVAQEFAEVFPSAVQPGPDRLADGSPVLQVDTYPATIHAIAAIQELNARLEEKDAQIRALTERLEAIEARLAKP